MPIRRLLCVIGLILLAQTSAFAAVPTLVNFQGRLADTTGLPVSDGDYSITFALYAAPTGGAALWSETQNVVVRGGIFNVLLGSVTPLDDSFFSSATRYLGIAVAASPELSPRQQIVTAPYSFRVATIDGAGGGKLSGKLAVGTNIGNLGSESFVAGLTCSAGGNQASVSGGAFNSAGGTRSHVGGGDDNSSFGTASAVGGGFFNQANADYATIPGGNQNIANGRFSFAAGRMAQTDDAGTFIWADSTNQSFFSTGPNQFLIRASGGVGIGTNAPRAPLHVQAGSSGVTSNASSVAILERNANCYLSILSPHDNERGLLFGDSVNSADGVIMYNNSTLRRGFQFRCRANGTRMVIDSLGNVGINALTPSERLQVGGNITATGTVCASNIACPSDERLKTNISEIHDACATIAKLRGVNFEWRTDEFPDRQLNDGKQIGVLAQDVQKVVPEAVVKMSDGYLAVDYPKLIPLLIEGMKEQQQQIAAQQAQIDELKSLLEKSARR